MPASSKLISPYTYIALLARPHDASVLRSSEKISSVYATSAKITDGHSLVANYSAGAYLKYGAAGEIIDSGRAVSFSLWTFACNIRERVVQLVKWDIRIVVY